MVHNIPLTRQPGRQGEAVLSGPETEKSQKALWSGSRSQPGAGRARVSLSFDHQQGRAVLRFYRVGPVGPAAETTPLAPRIARGWKTPGKTGPPAPTARDVSIPADGQRTLRSTKPEPRTNRNGVPVLRRSGSAYELVRTPPLFRCAVVRPPRATRLPQHETIEKKVDGGFFSTMSGAWPIAPSGLSTQLFRCQRSGCASPRFFCHARSRQLFLLLDEPLSHPRCVKLPRKAYSSRKLAVAARRPGDSTTNAAIY